ncbi:MOP flippase family protein [Leptothoe sp. PORK10 BA2]|uniref:MOP flippase family protein n=1 Tax=Leptothoe sp. PORK10 BA2 TaxID=3110254 RepID=UPI002B1EB3C5|nr:MOP flippase family protein [Leptothoe sp. PORK10 BA2]MEA5465668.1 MOP flippase family protein [Leptothoe sp. PORK10 BA2]
MSLRQKAIRGAKWSALEKWGAQLVSITIFLLLARLLGAEAFGLVALANVFMYFMQIFLDQGFAQAIIQKDELEPEHLDTAFWTSVLMGLVFLLAVFSGAGVVANFYSEPELAPIIRWMSISFLFAGLSSVQSAILQRNMQFKIFAARSLVATVACGIAGLGSALMGLGIWSLVIKEIVFGFTGAVMLWSSSAWRPRLRFSPKHFKELFSYGINIIGLNFLSFFNLRSDDMLIGYFLGPVALGYYSVAYRLLLIMIKLLTTVTTQVALPTFSRMQEDPERMRKTFYKVTQYTSLVSFPAFIGMAILAPELIQALFGAEWMPSVPVMRILAFSGILQSVYQFNGTILLSIGKPSWNLGLQCLSMLCNITVFVFLVHWGIVAVAIGLVIGGYVFSPIPLLLIKKIIHINLGRYLLQFLPPLISSAVMAIGLFVMRYTVEDWLLSDTLILVMGVVLGSLVYVFALASVSPKLIKEIRNNLFPIPAS